VCIVPGYIQPDHLDKTDTSISISISFIINQIISSIKLAIHIIKMNNILTTFAMIKAYTNYILNIETHIAFVNHKEDTFMGKRLAFLLPLNKT
jgi:hypothetical protein